MRKELELYLHIPFCVKKCAYCDFLSGAADAKTRKEYVDALLEEIQTYKASYADYKIVTIFLGGGTPSLLDGEQIVAIFRMLQSTFDIDEGAEISIEVNPGTVTREKLHAYRKAGINRLSIGLQSVNDEELRLLGRIHTYAEFLQSYEMARVSGFTNVNVDLIAAIPGQSVASWEQTLRTVAKLKPEHISAYGLILEEGTPFYEKYKGEAGSLLLPNEEEERSMYEVTEAILFEHGLHRYEVSNYAKEGYACRHNLGYWDRVEYLGIGLGASSLISGIRFHHEQDMKKYISAVRDKADLRREAEVLSAREEMEEFMFLGLRKTSGISKQRFREYFGTAVVTIYGKELETLERQGLLAENRESIHLTKRGADISNYVFEQFIL